jgi:phospholipid transport system transporter-binding protein
MNTFSLPEKITHAEAPEVLSHFKSALQTLKADSQSGVGLSVFRVDASPLKIFNSSALAVLLAFKRELQGLGLDLEVLNLPEQLQNLAKVYGVDLFLRPL